MYTLMMGPKDKPSPDAADQTQIHQACLRLLYRSSILPPSILAGIADKNPVMARPNTTPTSDSTEAIITQPKLNSTPLAIYNFLRPNVSE